MRNSVCFDLKSQMKGGQNEFCAAHDKAVECCDPSAEVFVKIDKWKNDASEHLLLHLAVVTRTCIAAQDISIKHAGWINLGKVVDPTSAIVERLKSHWNNPWSNCTSALVHQELSCEPPMLRLSATGLVSSVCLIAFDVSAPVQDWLLVHSFKEEIRDKRRRIGKRLRRKTVAFTSHTCKFFLTGCGEGVGRPVGSNSADTMAG